MDRFATLFARPIDGNNQILVSGEALAHLNSPVHAGESRSWLDDAGCRWYPAGG